MKCILLTGLTSAIGTWCVWRGYGKQWGKFSDFMAGEGTMGFLIAWGVLWVLFSGKA